MIPAKDALEKLREGNRRFVSGKPQYDAHNSPQRRGELVAGQKPFAIILGCSDSRVPAEVIFDQGLGDLFVVRVAGNIVGPTLEGSVEFAASQFGTRLVVVLGHSCCGAVAATLQQLAAQQEGEAPSPNIGAIVSAIRPAVAPLVEDNPGRDSNELMAQAVRENVRASARQLREGSHVLKDLLHNDGLVVVGAEYSLETGEVDFFDAVP